MTRIGRVDTYRRSAVGGRHEICIRVGGGISHLPKNLDLGSKISRNIFLLQFSFELVCGLVELYIVAWTFTLDCGLLLPYHLGLLFMLFVI